MYSNREKNGMGTKYLYVEDDHALVRYSCIIECFFFLAFRHLETLCNGACFFGTH